MLQVKKFTVNSFSENTYIVYNENKQAIIIDAGMYTPNEENLVFEFIAQNQLNPIQLINTHCHIDHVLGIAACIKKYNLPFGIHSLEMPILDWASEAGKRYGVPMLENPKPTFMINENNFIKLGDDELQVFFTPGHSPGSISFYSATYNFIFSGDVIFQNSIGRTDLPAGDFNTLINSIHTQIFTLPNDTIIYSGHGPETTVGLEKMNNPYVKG